MQRPLISVAAGLVLAAASGLASAASWTDIVAPGNYGRVAVGAYQQPPAVYSDQPIMATIAQAVLGAVAGGYAQPAYQQPIVMQQPPVYMWVPPVERANWAQYCGRYSACGTPVYFVQDRWYQDNVMAHRDWYWQQVNNRQAALEADRVARERWEQARWDRERADQARVDAQRTQEHWDQARIDRDRAERDRADHVRWEQQHGAGTQAVPAWQPGQQRPAWDHGQDQRAQGGDWHDNGRWQH